MKNQGLVGNDNKLLYLYFYLNCMFKDVKGKDNNFI